MSTRRLLALSTIFCVLASLSLVHVASGQEVTATIVGTITDPSGSAIKNAAVTATSTERGTVWRAETNDTGAYTLTRLPVGGYTVKVEAQGFQTALYPAFTLVLNQTARVDVAMKVGQVSETVEVTGEAPVLKTESTQVDTVINSATNDDLPLAARNYVQLTLLSPGSVTTNPQGFSTGNNTADFSSSRPLINGNREQANNFLLDGMDNNQVSDNLLGYTPAPDAIEEFNLITSNAPAEFGNFEGGIVSATIKSGTNSFHGDVWEYFRNDKLNANSWSNNLHIDQATGAWDPLPKAKVRWNMFGGTFGGPIIKNKLFFFADYQGQRFTIPSSAGANSVFTAAERGGDFSDLCQTGFTAGLCNPTPLNSNLKSVQLFNPCSSFSAPCTPPITNAASTRQPFLNNQIPTVMISPVASALFASSLYPSAIGAGTQDNAINTTASAFNVNQGDLKVDYKATQKDNISYRFTREYQENPGTNSQVLLGNSLSSTPIYNTVGDWTRTLTSNLVNDARIGWSHVTVNTGTAWDSSVGQYGNTLGIGNGNPGSLDGLLGLNFSRANISNFGTQESTASFDDHVWQFEDSLSWTHGRHNLKFGGQFWRDIIKTFYAGNNGQLGHLDFDGRFTESSAAGANTGDGGADFFLGLPFQYGRGVSTGKTWEQSSNIIGVYAQDTWRVTDRFTLNLGLRYDAHTPWVETHNQQANYNFATGNIDLAGQGGASRALYKGFYGGRDFQPRIGFAWTPEMLGGHTVLRGAFTISSYLEGTGTNLRLTLNPPFTPAEIDVAYNNAALPGTDTTDGIVGSAASAPCDAPAYLCYVNTLLRVWDPNVQPAIAEQWNFTIQHQLMHDTTFQIGYVGQKGTHLMVPFDYAQRVSLPNSSCPIVPPATTPGPCSAASPFFANNTALYTALGASAKVSGTRSNGGMEYNSLQAVLQKQMSHGLQYQVSYTYSKCMSDSTGYYGAWSNALSASAYWQNIYDPRAEWAPCYYDATHVISAYAIYDLPFGRGKTYGHDMNKVVDAVVGGWEISPIVSWRTGWPLPIFGSPDNTTTNSRGFRPDCNSIPSTTDTRIPGVGVQWFTNNGNFTDPAKGQFGNCAPQLGGLRSPHYADLDFSLHKDFQMTERFKLQFRTDFINAFNHVNFEAPNTSIGPTMGQITNAEPPRNIQLALKLYF